MKISTVADVIRQQGSQRPSQPAFFHGQRTVTFDRVKDMIISGGENVYPAEIESVLMAHPAVADAAVVGVPSDRWGETPKAFVVRVPGANIAAGEIIDYARRNLARYKCPTSVEWRESLPRNPTGKLLKKELRAPYWEGKDRQVH